MFGNMGVGEWIVILVIILIFFGPKRLPGLAQSLGKSVRELKNGLSGLTDDLKDSMQAEPKPAPQPTPTVNQSDAQPVSTAKAEEKKEDGSAV